MDLLLQALAAPRRREILRLLRRRERSAGEIHRALADVTFGAVSQHLGVLQQAGLVSARREGRCRFYATRDQGLRPLREWLDEMWDQALLRLKQQAEADEAPAPRGNATGTGRRREGNQQMGQIAEGQGAMGRRPRTRSRNRRAR